MVKVRPFLFGVLGCFAAAGTPVTFGASSSAIVVESRTDEPSQSRQSQELPFRPPVEEEPGAMPGGETQYQLQVLQQEVQQLRGQVEKLEHELSRMKATQEDRYLELDSRFQGLVEELGSGGSTSRRMDLDIDGEPGSGGGTSTSRSVSMAGGGQKAMYESALEMIRGRQYSQAIARLRQSIDEYPDGQYTANAYYWLGEVYAAKPEPEYENARQALAQVITYFPEHRKVPDAAFKLGKVYHLMGDCERAADILKQVVDQHKGKSVAKLAESYLKDKVSNCE